MPERVLTVKQPWADLIMAGVKDVENRAWPVPSTLPCRQCGNTKRIGGHLHCECDGYDRTGLPDHFRFPFRLWIHAGQSVDRDAYERLGDTLYATPGGAVFTPNELTGERGVLLGSVTVTGCHHPDEGSFPGPCVRRDATDEYVACSPWAQPDQYHWELADPVLLDEPIPMRGGQRLWRLHADVAVPA